MTTKINKGTTFSYERNNSMFPSISKINEINDEIEKLKKVYKEQLYKLEKEKEKIQSKCIHEYYIIATGMYDDSYECKFCGHETTR